MSQGWQFWVDRGGTFTDIIAVDPQGRCQIEKLLSDNAEQYEDAVLEGIQRILSANDLTIASATVVKMGTTVATNALLQRNGANCALLITQGFEDSLQIGYQYRRHLFALAVNRPQPLYQQVIGIQERINHQGDILLALDEEKTNASLQALKKQGVTSLAIVLLHAIQNPEHEHKIAKLARKAGFKHIYCSHQTSPTPKLVRRGQTTVIDAYITPVLKHYIDAILTPLAHCQQWFMQSNGGLTQANTFLGKNSLLSGPAGGAIGAIHLAKQLGFDNIIGFDMGGTSTDVCHYRGELERCQETDISGYLLDIPMLNIHTVAAGGGSMLQYQDNRLVVGPQSAGADPGPACYRRGGPLTVTDAALVTGKIPVDSFNQHLPEQQSLDIDKAQALFKQLAKQMLTQQTAEAVASQFLQVAIDNMSQAIKQLSVDKGYDLADYTLISFGGAGGQHACLIAENLGMKQVLIPSLASVLSAYGIGQAAIRKIERQSIEQPFNQLFQDVIETMTRLLKTQVNHEGTPVFITQYFLKYEGNDYALAIQVGASTLTSVKQQFEQLHQHHYGFYDRGKTLILESIQVEMVIQQTRSVSSHHQSKSYPERENSFYSRGNWHQARAVDLMNHRGQTLPGPMLLVADHTTIVIEPGWQASVDESGHVILTTQKTAKLATTATKLTHPNPMHLEIFHHAFMNGALLMGSVLVQTARSVNIKERRDFSCALFDKSGRLIANAPHMPVHLGSMGESVKAVIRSQTIIDGNSYMTNNPYHGGTHLPDITIITPVFYQKQLFMFVASRGHHADVGGISPGSLPANSQHIDEEGIVFDHVLCVKQGQFQYQILHQLFAKGGARSIDQNLADIKAQLAANQKGIQEIQRLIDHYGHRLIQDYIGYIQQNAQACVQQILTRLNSGEYSYAMDNGMNIQVAIRIDKQKAIIDFSGTSPQQANNFNAPVAVVKACVLYVLRTMIDHEMPLNEGCLDAIELIIPKHSLINPDYPAAVVAGNVETSQALVNALFLALKKLAASQGTMNNITFGNETCQYYETIAGGTGAGQDFPGCDAIHSHMTNSWLTDPEVLETRFPVRLLSFGIRKASGGSGHFRGGHGCIRHLVFLDSLTVNMISNHRQTAPPGLAGGNPGKPGRHTLITAEGEQQSLPGCFTIQVKAGDQILIETPGGGGYGEKEK